MGCTYATQPKKSSENNRTNTSLASTKYSSPTKPGDIKKTYTIHEVIASGNFGTIRRCVFRNTKEEYAVREILGNKNDVDKCFNQVNLLEQLVLYYNKI